VARGRTAALLVADRSGLTALLQRGYERLQTSGVAGIADLLDPEFEVQTAPDLPEAGTYRGAEDFGKLVTSLVEPFDEIRLETGQIVELAEDLLLVPLRIHGRGRLSGLPLDTSVMHLWTMRGGKALRLRVFTSPEQVAGAIVRDAYEAYNSRGFEAIKALLDPDVVLYEEPEIPDANVRHGPDGVAQYFQEAVERWQTFELEMDQVVQVTEQVIVVTGVMRGRGSLSGADVESRFGHIYELENWRAKRITFYFDPEKALEAARSSHGAA
jgi:ketosteroid isomerase-like protein